MKLKFLNGGGPEHVGYIPQSLYGLTKDESLTTYFNKVYAHGGGWRHMSGWKLNPENGQIKYPGDPPLKPRAEIFELPNDELVYIYDHAWVVVVKKDGSFEISRMD